MASSSPPSPSPSSSVISLICFASLIFLPWKIQAQFQPATDPGEVSALNTMLGRWNLKSTWNITSDPCTGTAVDDTQFPNMTFNPFIKCNCNYLEGTVCHITKLMVTYLDVVGTVPYELTSLPELVDLRLNVNYLKGPLPSFIGNLSNLQHLDLGANPLTGSIPKELGDLTNLVSLGLGTTNFSGPLPPELGNLINLIELNIDSCGIDGEIPTSFSQLQNLEKLWAFDNKLTGRIPDFIGSLTSLTDLRLYGNSFDGPIPSSLGNLVNLTDLRIGGLMNAASSLAFIKDMGNLNTLILRNCNITGSIPSDIGGYASLKYLDLSFNNLAGQIPPSLFGLSNLTLILGNNILSGGLPELNAPNLFYIDLSYNNLSGRLPSWAYKGKLKFPLNIVANNFEIDSSNSDGLECLQKNMRCSHSNQTWSSFAINCGGTSLKTSDGTSYDMDGESSNSTSYYVSGDRKWAFSTTGILDNGEQTFTQHTSSKVSNSTNPVLFQSARSSLSSLRYYGLQMENGEYNVELLFAETAITNPPGWKSFGRRVFDIYVQGNLVAQDFDIRKETNGLSFRAIERSYLASVTQNFLEIHFFWAGRGTCCIPTRTTQGPLVSAIRVTPSTSGDLDHKKGNSILVIGTAIGVAILCILFAICVWLWWRNKSQQNLPQELMPIPVDNDKDLLGMAMKVDVFSYEVLLTATEYFNPENKLGEGGFGVVFKGKLSDGRAVAVKKLSVTSNYGNEQFLNEIAAISAVQHRNLVKLYGCCCEGDNRLLVYEYLENKSLDRAIFGKNYLHLDWSSRIAICSGIARGLTYLHESSPRIVHRDVKASNILLDNFLNPKIADFGLAKLYDDNLTHMTTRIAGTVGYLAPEYYMTGMLTEKADVFAFGVLALEIISGRPCKDLSLSQEKVYLLQWAWNLHEQNKELEMMDPTLSGYVKSEANRVIRVALLCSQMSPLQRPTMLQVVSMLAGDTDACEVVLRQTPDNIAGMYYLEDKISEVPSRPAYMTDLYTSTTGTVETSSSAYHPMLGGAFGKGR